MGEFLELAEKCVHECKWEPRGQFIYHKCQVPPTVNLFKANDRLCCIVEGFAVTQELMVEEQPDSSLDGIILSVPTATGVDQPIKTFDICQWVPELPVNSFLLCWI